MFYNFVKRCLIDFWSIFGRFWDPSWGQVGPKIEKNDAKLDAKKHHEKSSENNGPKPFKNQPQIDQKSIENQPKIDPKSIETRPKIDQKSTRSEKCRALRLGSRLGGVLEASWAHLRGQAQAV